MNSKLAAFLSIGFLILRLSGYSQSQNLPGFEILPVNKNLRERMLATEVFGDNSPVPIDRLRLLRLTYFGFDGKDHGGELIVLDACSKQVLNIFTELYQKKFPMEKVALMTEYKGNDSLSMAQNNTSGHNLRLVTGGKSLSLHAYGTAIDLNPVNNPFVEIACDENVGIARYQPAAGIKYANRRENRLGKANRKGMAEDVLDLFAKHGFYWWGGYWNCPIDYQHFQISRSITELLVAMSPNDAAQFFERTVHYFNRHQEPIETVIEAEIGIDNFADFYRKNPSKFQEIMSQLN